MKVLVGLLIASCMATSFIASWQRDQARSELNSAKQDLRLVIGLYNGVLIARGCGLAKGDTRHGAMTTENHRGEPK
jgi:hypothetical protein